MENHDFNRFLAAAAASPALGAELGSAADPAAVAALGARHGFAFAAGDVSAFGATPPGATVLTDEELKQIAGGAQTSLELGLRLTRKDTCGTPCCVVERL